MEQVSIEVANALQTEINETGLGLVKFAEKLGISYPTLKEWLSGKYNFKLNDFQLIEKTIGRKLVKISLVVKVYSSVDVEIKRETISL